MPDDEEGARVRLVSSAPLTPHDEALYEAGKKLLVDSVDVGRDLCKTMTTVAVGAIPVHVALVGLVVGQDAPLQTVRAIVALIAPALFLVSMWMFALGYYPTARRLSLELPEQIEKVRDATISRRRRMGAVGFGAFSLGVVSSLGALMYLAAH
jgi:hypothetical protein